MSALPVSGCWDLGFRVLGFGLEGLWLMVEVQKEPTNGLKYIAAAWRLVSMVRSLRNFILCFELRTATVSLNSAWILLYSSEKG